MVETNFGCKWPLTVYQLLGQDINRPGQMIKNVEGPSTKVLNDCLKTPRTGILEKVVYHELPPRVEYKVTGFGSKFIGILDQIEKLQDEIDEVTGFQE